MINGKLFEHRPISQLMAIVRQDLRKLDEEGLIDEGTLIKTIMYCNEKLGILIREVKQCVIPVEDYKAQLPIDFEKLHYICALHVTNTSVTSWKNPFDHSFDRDIIYEANVSRDKFAGANQYSVTINKITNMEITAHSSWVELEVSPQSYNHCHPSCPNMHRPGKHQIVINDDYTVSTPFKKGELYIMYLGSMKDEEGNIVFPFHPMITPYYEWMIKEKVLTDAVFNSDGNYGELLKLAKQERAKAWLDAFNITTERSYGQYVAQQKEQELNWYKKYFSYFK